MRAQLRPAFGAAAFFASSCPPSTLRLRREEEENEECRRDTSGELIAAQNGGDSRRRWRTTELDSRVRVTVSGVEEMVRGEREKQRGGFTYRSRGRGAGRAQGRTAMAAWRTGRPLWRQEQDDDDLQKSPWQPLINLQKGPEAGFSNLIEAPGHFYKMCKNSHRLHLTFRCSTKIGKEK